MSERRVSLTLACVIAAMVATSFLVRVDLPIRDPSFAQSDGALIALGVLRADRGEQLLGPYSRFGWQHPGPFYFHALRPFHRVLGGGIASVEVGAWGITALACGGIVGVVARASGVVAAAWAFLALLHFSEWLGQPFGNLWNPYVTIPVVALFLATAALAALGRRSALVAAATLASFLAQTHVAYAPLGAVVGVTAFGLAARRWEWRTVAIVVAVLGALWSAPLYEELTSESGNLSRLLAFAQSSESGRSFADAASVVLARVGAAWAGAPVRWGVASEWWGGAAALLCLATTLVARRRNPWAAALAGFACIGMGLACVSLREIPDELHGYLTLWISALGFVAAVAVGAAIAPSRPSFRATALGLVVIALLAARNGFFQEQQPSPGQSSDGTVAGLWPPVARHLETRGVHRPLLRLADAAQTWPPGAGLVLELEERGYDLEVEPAWSAVYGRHRASVGAYDRVLVLGLRESVPTDIGSPIAQTGPFAVWAEVGPTAIERWESELSANPRDPRAFLNLQRAYAARVDEAAVARLDAHAAAHFDLEHRLGWNFGNEIELLGFEVESAGPRAVEIRYQWRVLRKQRRKWTAWVHVRGEGVELQDDHALGTPGRRTDRWPVGLRVEVRRVLRLPDDAPQGRYEIELGIWDESDGTRLRPEQLWPWQRRATLGELRLAGDTLRLEGPAAR